jgi:radical SAM protein with 4Fe4S-binding SPASM domain
MSVGPNFGRLARLAEARCIPLSVTLELGLSCNLRCVHCYNFDRDLPRHPSETRGAELSDGEVFRVIGEVRAEGALFLAFTGGEPLSHPRLEDFVADATRSGLFVRLKSNGTLLTGTRAETLARRGLKAVDVSVYGASPRTHDDFVRQEGAWARTLEGVRSSRRAGLEVRLSLMITSANSGETASMIELARSLEVPFNVDTHVTARHDGSRGSLGIALDRPALEALYEGPLAIFLRSPRAKGDPIACPCARSVCGIGSCGDVYPCIGAPLPAGNLRQASFREIWRDAPALQWVRSLRNEDFPACGACDHAGYCHRTGGVMLNNTGEFTGPRAFGEDSCCVEAEVIHRMVERAGAGSATVAEGISPLCPEIGATSASTLREEA